MITVTRLAEPEILKENREKWLTVFLKKRERTPGKRPPSSQYGHKEIRDTLRAMSFHKCFYCERKLTEKEDEVDHYVEVAETPEKAFDWENLYLSCSECNKKFPNKTIPVSDCLNPCDLSENPAEHLTFEDEFIKSKTNSPKALKTIQKYKLNRDELNYLRSKALQRFEQCLRKIRERQIRDHREILTSNEKEAILRFKNPDHHFSLMFSVYLSEIKLE